MSTTRTTNINGEFYDQFPMQKGLTVGDLLHFLGQFPDLDQPINFYLIAEDETPFVGLYADTPLPGHLPTPMIVTSFVPEEDV